MVIIAHKGEEDALHVMSSYLVPGRSGFGPRTQARLSGPDSATTQHCKGHSAQPWSAVAVVDVAVAVQEPRLPPPPAPTF